MPSKQPSHNLRMIISEDARKQIRDIAFQEGRTQKIVVERAISAYDPQSVYLPVKHADWLKERGRATSKDPYDILDRVFAFAKKKVEEDGANVLGKGGGRGMTEQEKIAQRWTKAIEEDRRIIEAQVLKDLEALEMRVQESKDQ